MSNNNTFFNIAKRIGLEGTNFQTGSYFHNRNTDLRLTIHKITGSLSGKAHFRIDIHFCGKGQNDCLFSGQWSGEVLDLRPLVCRFLADRDREFHYSLLSAGTQSGKKKFLRLENYQSTSLGW